jgi:thiamine pyrophosphate-dependent acetolactate synthase large subunit-like protein
VAQTVPYYERGIAYLNERADPDPTRRAVPIGGSVEAVTAAAEELSATLRRAAAVDGPALVELVLPADPEAWRGIWVAQGFEQAAPVSVG